MYTDFPVAAANFRALVIKSLYCGIFAAARIRLGFVVASVGLYFFMARKCKNKLIKNQMINKTRKTFLITFNEICETYKLIHNNKILSA